jgi:NADPH:quinone reductase-like Zn-dependent oxidoreductase
MRAVVLHDTGDPDGLRLEEEWERPEPAEGEVLIRVRAAAVNPIDWKYRLGMMPKQVPAILGSDVSGTVEVSRAEGFAAGDDVFGLAAHGAYAEFTTSPAGMIARKPPEVTHEQAAAIPVAGLTAWQAMYDRAGVERGQTALISGAAGGVGHLAVQFAKLGEARTIGIGSPRNRDFVLGLGAEEYVDYTQQDVAGAVSDVDVALDTVGGAMTQALLSTLNPGGVLITIAAAAPEDAAAARGARAELLSMRPNPEQLVRIAELVGGGDVHVEISQTFPLSQTMNALELSESGHARGKIVVSV